MHKMSNISRSALFRSHIRKRSGSLRGSLRLIPGAWLLVDYSNGRIVTTSKDFDNLLGVDRNFLRGSNLSSIGSLNITSGWITNKLDISLLSQPGRYEDVGIKSKDESPIVADMRVSHPKEFGKNLAICLVTDRSQQRRLQGELIKKHQELRKAFSDLETKSEELLKIQKELENKNIELGRLSAQTRSTATLAAIGEITAELTHQLNNPLAAAFGAARRLKKLNITTQCEETASMIDLLGDALERMHNTMGDLRMVYRNTILPDSPNTAQNLKEIINSTLTLLQQRLIPHRVVLELPEDLPLAMGRSSQIQHVIVNLIDNALEFVGDQGIIHIAADADEEHVFLRIGDSGPGIPENDREKIFAAFYTTREKGSGLGLAVVRRYLERDKAGIKIGYSKYGGAEFEITFIRATTVDGKNDR